jgi:ribosomal protein S18 acetylase RimI-like enzyme
MYLLARVRRIGHADFMAPGPLDNPIWSSLTTEQSSLARGTELAKRYEAEVAPFAAIGSDSARAADELASIVEHDECVYLVGLAPTLDARWSVIAESRIVQMVWQSRVSVNADESEIELLGARDNSDMISLTAAVFPGFFRPRTREMGAYYGIRKGSVLAAMAGERMRITGNQEISAVCTHPDFIGRGYAARLVTHLTDLIRARGATPFLHVGEANVRARELYLRVGFVERALLPMCYMRRTTVGA